MISEQTVPLSIIAGYLGLTIFLAETLHRLFNYNAELTRKIVHIGSGNVILIAWWLNIPSALIIQAASVASVIAIASYFLPILPSLESVGRKSLGTLFYAISIGVLTAWFWGSGYREYAAMGILVMSWGDGMAALIGLNWGKHTYQLWGSQKSWEGSLTMMLVSLMVISLILLGTGGWQWHYFLIALSGAIFAAILETFSRYGIDNFTVPVGSALLCFYLHNILS